MSIYDDVIKLCYGDAAQRDKVRCALAPYVAALERECTPPDHECVRCGAEDSETANGCDLCFECGSLLDVAREAVAAVNEAEVPNMREQLARWLAVLEKWSDDSSKKLEAT